MRYAALATAVLIVGCGGGDNEDVASGGSSTSTSSVVTTSTTVATVSTTTSSSTTVPATASTEARSPVSTTLPPSLADTTITQDDVPESTASNSFRPLAMNGVSYVNALSISSDRTPRKVEINAGRNKKRFRGVLGIPDDEGSSSSHQVEISFDNAAPALSVIVNFGEVKEIDLDVTNVLRIRITVSSRNDLYGSSVAIGNPRFG